MMCRLCLKEWLPAIQANHKNFALYKGDLLFREGEEMKGIYFVYSGLFKVHKQWGADKELIVRFATSGDIIGHRGLGKDDVYPVSATALEASIVCYVDIEFFLGTLKVNTEFMYRLMIFYASELKESEKNMRNLAHMQVKGRIAQALFNLREKFGTDRAKNINVALSRQDLASYVGTSYETLFRLLNELSEENIIALDGKKIAIINEEELSKYVSDEPQKDLIS
jgi:CRP/FNR family transcriptional regulator